MVRRQYIPPVPPAMALFPDNTIYPMPQVTSSNGFLSGLMGGTLPYLSIFSPILASFTSGGGGYLFDSLRLFLLGALLEGVRRVFMWLVGRFRFQMTVTARFYESDLSYDWIVNFLTEENVWKRACEFDVSAKSSMRKFGLSLSSPAPITSEKGQANAEEKGNADYVPTWSIPQLFRWKGYWVEVAKSEGAAPQQPFNPNMPPPPIGASGPASNMIILTVYAFRMSVLSDLVEEARRRYIEAHKPHVIIHVSEGNHGPGYGWANTKSKPRRPISSVVLPSGTMTSLLTDLREFLASETWYNGQGIPHRRGYLLYGPPGTGKSSTIYSLAGELGLEIYSLSLASGNIDDLGLMYAANGVPKGSILLIEDIDCAFPSREDEDDDEEEENMYPGHTPMPWMNGRRTKSLVTMSGLLNVLDGVGSDEGKIFFATTNYVDRLDPALMRPGRIDRKIEYRLANRTQAKSLFLRFFTVDRFTDLTPPSSIDSVSSSSSSTSSQDEKSIQFYLEELSERFSSQIPNEQISTAELQGYLLTHKSDPVAATEHVGEWVEQEKKEKEEREEREKARKEKARAKKDARWGAWGREMGGIGPMNWNMGNKFAGPMPPPAPIAAPAPILPLQSEAMPTGLVTTLEGKVDEPTANVFLDSEPQAV